MKKRIDVIASVESFENLSQFKEIEEMNKTVRTYHDVIKTSVKRSDVQVRLITLLELLKRHSCKQVGVSYMCKNTISSYLNVSYKTVQRLMKKLEDMNMIKQIATKRKSNMQQTANAVVIVPEKNEVSDKTVAKESDKCPTNKTISSSLKQNIKNIRNSAETVDKSVDSANVIDYYDYTYVSSSVPLEFINAVKPFFSDASKIYRLWSRLQLAAKNYNVDAYVYINEFIKTFKETIYNVKQRRNRQDIIGYVFGAWRNTAAVICRKMNVNNSYNWLED